MDYKTEAALKQHISDIINFYDPKSIDYKRGGYINQMRDDGSIFDNDTKHLVGTCRFVYNYSLSYLVLGNAHYKEAAEHGVKFLLEHHKQANGGYAWVLNGTEVEDGNYHCYGHAFVLLAAAGAKKANTASADQLLADIWDLLETRFWDPEQELYVDEIIDGDWNKIDPYRGQNANMHMCEAMLSAWEATSDRKFLDRAYLLAKRICVDLAAFADGLIWEHYHEDWTHDWSYNLDDPKNLFRPYGYLPGHFTEWAKLLLILNRYLPHDWLVERAEFLFNTALKHAWHEETGAIFYTFSPEGEILDRDQYYWVFSESLAASALLANVTKNQTYWTWYDRFWLYADTYFIDHKYGAWYRVLDENGQKYSDEKSPASKTDYHPLAACYEVLQSYTLDT